MRRASWVIALLAIWCSAPPGRALTLSDLKTEIRRNVRDTSTSSTLQRYSDGLIRSFINEAQKDVVNDTWCLQNTTFYVLTAGVTYYALPSDFLAVMQVNYRESTGRIRGLDEVSKRALFQQNPDWARQAGPPVNYFTQYSTQAATTLDIVYVPIPTSASTGTAIIDYYSTVTDLSDDSDVAFNGLRHLYPYHHSIIDLVSYRISMIEGDVSAAEVYLKMYAGRVQTMMNRFKNSPNYLPSVGAVGSSGGGR